MKPKKVKSRQCKVTKIVAAGMSLVLCYYLSVTTLPLFSESLQNMAVLSAGITFLDGGLALLRKSGEEQITLAEREPQTEQGTSTTIVEEVPETSESTASQEEASAPERIENSGDVVRQTITAGNGTSYVSIGAGTVRNLSGLSAEQVKSYAREGVPFRFEETDAPQVLIYHTHATESYQPYSCDWYDLSYNARSKDDSKNMIAVGNVLEEKLKAAGIGVIHDTTQHDNPSYTGGYDRSRETIQKHLKENPTIKVVLDVHRDALQGDKVITAPYTEINGTKTAQIMTICCADDGTDRLPNFTENFKFAAALQNQAETDYPTLMRPMLFDKNRSYNQDLSVGALLFEVGGHGNTLQEAKNAMSFLADSLIKVLKETA